VPLFGRALLEMGTQREDFVSLSQHISCKTGGIKTGQFASSIMDAKDATAWLLLRGKATMERTPDLLEILLDILLSAEFDNRQRFKQILLQEKAKQEQKIIPSGHLIVNSRIRAHLNESDWIMEKMTGLSYFYFLKELENIIDSDWGSVLTCLQEMRAILLNRSSMVINITADKNGWENIKSKVISFTELLPAKKANTETWSPENLTEFEGMIIPAQVNYVGKGADLYDLGYTYHGSVHVITHLLRTTWLWEQVRVLGGAYGALCRFDKFSGAFSLVSYRDPNLLETLNTFDKTPQFLAELKFEKAELTKSIIGAIGEIDGYMFPDTKGLVSMQRYLNGTTDDSRQMMREQILATTPDDFKAFAEILNKFKEKSIVKVLGSENSINLANKEKGNFLKTFNVL
jgi:Zn-dependent M16 (insulinase) family peptidase